MVACVGEWSSSNKHMSVLFIEDERSEDVDADFERCHEWDVVEHAEPRQQERGGPL